VETGCEDGCAYVTSLQMSLAEYKKRQQKLKLKSREPERRASSTAVAKTPMPVCSKSLVNIPPPPVYVKQSTKSGSKYVSCNLWEYGTLALIV